MTNSVQDHAEVRSVITLQARLKELKKSLQSLFDLNSRYLDDAIFMAQSIIKLSQKLGFNHRKVIFGSRDLFEKLSKKHLSQKERQRIKEEWKDKRQGILYSIGDKSKGGNLNLSKASLTSLQREPRAVGFSTDGRKGLTAKRLRRSPDNLWQILKVAVLTAHSPEKHRRCFSPLKPLLVSGDVERALYGREFLLLGAGAMAGSNTASWGLSQSEEAGYKYPSPDSFIQSG